MSERGEHAGRVLILALGIVSVAAVARLRDPARAGAPSTDATASITSGASATGSSSLPGARATASSRRPTASESAGRHGGIVIRLVDRLESAMVDAPEFSRVDREVSHWRRMRSPWAGPSGEAGRAVQVVSLVRSGPKRTAREAGALWVPDPHVWNMDEGSFDQRESILAPPPATLRFRGVSVPVGAALETAPAIMGPSLGGVDFEVAVHAAGARTILGQKHVEGGKYRAFADWRLDLSQYAGRVVDLELSTRASAPDGKVSPAAIWGTPVVVSPAASTFPFNVLFIVVDALRADALSAAHDPETDARNAKADPPPLDAWLPNLPEVAPNLDALARRGVIFTQAYSSGIWTRPGTIGMLAGSTSGDFGLSALPLIPAPADVRALYAKRPSFLPLLLRDQGVDTRAVVNNFYMVGYAGVGVDMGFEAMVDHRYAREDTTEILRDTTLFLEARKDRRFCLFVNFASPHVPYQPPTRDKAAIPGPPRSPEHRLVRAYLAEIHKDDAAIGELVAKLDALGLGEDTLIVVTADHGETLSAAHDAVPEGVDGGPAIGGRFHHLSSLYDETAHVPLILVWPKRLPAGLKLGGPISTIDIVPTVLDLAGQALPANVRGASLLPRVRGEPEPDRLVLTEGRGAHALRVGRYRLVVRDAAYRHVRERGRRIERSLELYDLETDPGERIDVSRQHPEVVERLTKLDRERASAAERPVAPSARPVIRLRFTSAGLQRRLTGFVSLGSKTEGKIEARVSGLPDSAIRRTDTRVFLEGLTSAEAPVGLDLVVDPPDTDLEWQFWFDGEAVTAHRVYAGAFGTRSPSLVEGMRGAAARAEAQADAQPWIDAERDNGLFVTRDAATDGLELARSDAAKEEAMGLMRAWGYIRTK